jgi:2,3-bisphosphoglycerate-dependent phosphoglycerate mutase
MIIRHGFSTWNELNLFTGWEDVPLCDRGVEEANRCCKSILESNFRADVVYTSVLDRAIKTKDIILQGLETENLESHESWRLNERHYGALTGLNKIETVEKYGEEQVLKWRRSFDIAPPPVEEESKYNFRNDPLYKDVPQELIPLSECLKDVCERVRPFYNNVIKPRLIDKQNVMIVAHGNSLRALIKDLENLSGNEIVNFELPTATARLFEFNDDMSINLARYIENEEVVRSRANAVKAQIVK